jgi:hypothetical protein
VVIAATDTRRADLIRQFRERGSEDMAELQIVLEEWEWPRQAPVEELRRADG